MNRSELIATWVKSADDDTLLTSKHDPNTLYYFPEQTRSVVSYEVSSSLKEFIHSEDYEIEVYHDVKHPGEGGYFILKPGSTFRFKSLGHSIAVGSFSLHGSKDRLLIVSGSEQGWHIAAEDYENVKRREREKTLFMFDKF